jgi:hypothetical protein
MSKQLVETLYTKYAKYEIYRHNRFFGTVFYVYRDGRYVNFFKSLLDAVNYVRSKTG